MPGDGQWPVVGAMLMSPAIPAGINALRLALGDAGLTPRLRADLLSELALQCAHAGLARDGLDAVKEAVELADAHQLPLAKERALNAAAVCHNARGDFLMAIACGIDAYIGFAQDNQHADMGHALTTVAAACKDVRAFDLAERVLRGCINIARRAGDQFLLARTQNTLAELVGDLQRFDEAGLLLADSRANMQASGRQDHLAQISGNQCRLHKKMAQDAIHRGAAAFAARELREAIALMHAGMDETVRNNDQYELLATTRTLGEYHFLLGENLAARGYFDGTLALARQLNHALLICESQLFLGRLAMLENDPASAQRWLGDSLAHARRRNIMSVQPELHTELAILFAATARPNEAELHRAAAQDWSRRNADSHREVEREARAMWTTHFSRHPLIENERAGVNCLDVQ